MTETEFKMKGPRTLGGSTQCLYVTVHDPDTHNQRAPARQGRPAPTIVLEPFDTDYGARNYCVRDLEGHLWSFGTYTYRPRAGNTADQT